MDNAEREQLRRHVENWRAVNEKLAELERQELPLIDTQQVLLSLAGAFEASRRQWVPPPTSGLIEQQAIFRRMRK